MRISIAILSFGMAAMLLGCGLFNRGQQHSEAVDAMGEMQKAAEAVDAVGEVRKAAEARDDTAGPPLSGPLYFGLATLEEQISGAYSIVRAELLSVAQDVEPVYFRSNPTEFSPALMFRFRVLEYLKGSGGTEIVAAIIQTRTYETRAEAEAQAEDLLVPRDKRWDDREAVLFLWGGWMEDRYMIGYHSYYGEDGYTVASRHYRGWLPEAAGQTGGTTGFPDGQRFLLGLESSGTDGETITLGELKSKIAEIEAEIQTGGGSLEYRVCVARKYLLERWSAHNVSRFGGSYNFDPFEHSMESGLAAETVVYEGNEAQENISRYGENPTEKPYRYWSEGEDKGLFDVRYPGRVFTKRPLPADRYKFYYNKQESELVLCNAYPEAERTRFGHVVEVTAPAGTLHELFFDPVTAAQSQGGPAAIAADLTNGVLKPATFTDANGASATIQSISYETGSGQSGTGSESSTGMVEMTLTPHTGLADHVLDFIALDGSVILSLDADEATVDAATNTLSWPMPHRPWKDGDKLMVRIHDGPATPVSTPTPTVAPTPGPPPVRRG